MADQVKNDELTPEEQKEKETYMQWAKRQYGEQYENWMPWIEDQYLRFFTKDNKTSYAVKGTIPLSFPPIYVDIILNSSEDTVVKTVVDESCY
jgi:hypothetical protein